MRQRDLEERTAARKQKLAGAQDTRMEKLEALCAAQESRLKRIEDMMTELHANITRVSTPPVAETVPPKQKPKKGKSGARPRPNRTSSNTAEEVVAPPTSSKTPPMPSRSQEDITAREDAADPKPMVTSDEKADTKTDVISGCIPATQDEGALTTTGTIEEVDAAEDMVHDGREEGATTEERGREQDVEAEESETEDDEHSPAPVPRDITSGVSAPVEDKVSSPQSDEQDVVSAIATLSTEKPAPDDVGT